jgi:lipid-A-disaccharide synthase
MRIFMSTGEASGDMTAAALAEAIREQRPDATFTGIGNERMRAAGFALTARTNGWASMGPIDALGKIPGLAAALFAHVFRLCADPVDLIVLIDFGAFNVRLARILRAFGYKRPILYFFPPSAWFDKPRTAYAVAKSTRALTAFEHQRNFYRSLGLEIGYVGHPLVSLVQARPARSAASNGGGVIALLPGSRRREVLFHLPRLLQACALLQERRPDLEILVSVAANAIAGLVQDALARERLKNVRLVQGSREALDAADVAFVASGTAVLEATLREVPTVALYVVSEAQAKIARRIYKRRFVTLPNLLLDRPLVPELLQEDATPQGLAQAAGDLLRDASAQLAGMREVRGKLGPADALKRCAVFALETAAG